MKKVLRFLSDLSANNNREWFMANKALYTEAESIFNAFAAELIEAIGAFDPSVRTLTLKDCTYRIYRDVRFSKNKSPYKTHMGVYVCPGGKKSGNAGYYFHVEAAEGGMIGQHLMSAGIYMPEPKVLKSVRDEIFDNGEQVVEAIEKARGFTLDRSNRLTRTPAGYPAGSPFDDYLRQKDFHLTKTFSEDYLLADGLAERAAADFRRTYPFMSLMNRAAQFAHEEM